MSRPRNNLWRLTALALVVCLLLAAPVFAQVSAEHNLSWNLISSGSLRMQSPDHTMWGSLSQPATSVMTSSDHTLCAGFWCLPVPYMTYLPLVQR